MVIILTVDENQQENDIRAYHFKFEICLGRLDLKAYATQKPIR